VLRDTGSPHQPPAAAASPQGEALSMTEPDMTFVISKSGAFSLMRDDRLRYDTIRMKRRKVKV
jgi:hypothetical protein